MIKRTFDLLIALLLLVALSPMLIGCALAVVLTSTGPVFYRQVRVGRNNIDFRLFKFRTMYQASDQKGLLTVGMRDPRITGVGFFLRKYKLDELPQLLNVIRGDMSLVGPRPEVRKYVSLYSEEQLRVLTVRPGITDFASIAYHNENALLARSENPEQTYIREIMPEKLRMNLEYIENNGLLTDLRILLRTVFTVVRHR